MMDRKIRVLRSFNRFLAFSPGQLTLIVAFTIILAFSQGIGYLLLVPILKFFQAGKENSGHSMIRLFENISQRFQITLTIEFLILAFVFIVVIVFILQNRKAVLQNQYQQRFSGFIRKDFYRKILFSDWDFLTRFSKTQHIQALTSEIPRVTNFYFYMLSAFTRIIILLILLIPAFLISHQLSLLVLFLGSIQFIILSGYFRRSFELGAKGRSSYREMLRVINDFWITLKPAKIHKTEQFYYGNFEKADDRFVRNQIKQFTNNQRPQFLYSILGLVNMVVFVCLSLHFSLLPVHLLIVFILLFGRIVPLFVSTFNDINLMFSNADSLINMEKIIFPEHKSLLHAIEGENYVLKECIRLKGVSFSYSENNQIFENFSAEIYPFRITGISGKSGSGKTTLVDLISGLIFPNNGLILFDDLELNKHKTSFLNKIIAYLPQDSLFIDGSVRENLVWDTEAKLTSYEITDVLEKVNASDFLKMKGLQIDSPVTNFKYTFSGGELQRLALARVLLRKPQIMILDEATSALDEENEDNIFQILHELKVNTTIIFVTHKRRLLQLFDNVIEL